MFLSPLGDAVAVQNYSREALEPNAPLLISSAAAFTYAELPAQWQGAIYTTKAVLSELKQEVEDLRAARNCGINILNENVPTVIQTYEAEPQKVTAIALVRAERGNKVLFLISDSFVSRLCADALTDDLNVVITNLPLKKAISSGIDVLHVNDTCYCRPELTPTTRSHHPTDFQLHALAYLVCPRKIVGLHADLLPKHLTKCCRQIDFFVNPQQKT